MTVLSRETTPLTAEAPVSIPTRLIFPGRHMRCPGRRPIQSSVESCSICLFSTWVSYLCHCVQSQTTIHLCTESPRSFRELGMHGECWGLPRVTQIYGLTLSSNSMLEYGLEILLEIYTTDATPQLTHGCSTGSWKYKHRPRGTASHTWGQLSPNDEAKV